MAKRRLSILLGSIMILGLTGCFGLNNESTETTYEYIKRTTALDVSSCKIENEEIDYGFHGDGGAEILIDCHEQDEQIIKQIKDWKKLPLSSDLAKYVENDKFLPNIDEGYYYFVNRHREAKSMYDEEIFGKYSFNFTLIIYDINNKKMYYYRNDT